MYVLLMHMESHTQGDFMVYKSTVTHQKKEKALREAFSIRSGEVLRGNQSLVAAHVCV